MSTYLTDDADAVTRAEDSARLYVLASLHTGKLAVFFPEHG